MVREKRTVRASEIGTFVYCQRAWWYQRRGFVPINRKKMAAGSAFHNADAGRNRSVILLRIFAWVLVFASLVYLGVILYAGRLN